jgi:hypothetical protein
LVRNHGVTPADSKGLKYLKIVFNLKRGRMQQNPIRIKAIERLDWLALKIPDLRQDIGKTVQALLDYVQEAPQRAHPLERDPVDILAAFYKSRQGLNAPDMKAYLSKEQYEELLAGLKDCVVYCQLIVYNVNVSNKRKITEHLVDSQRKLEVRYRTS